MKPLAHNKLGKMLALTNSSHDSEALVAVRLAGLIEGGRYPLPAPGRRWRTNILEERTATTAVLSYAQRVGFSTPCKLTRSCLAATKNKDVAAWIVAHLDNRDFAQSLFEFACGAGRLTASSLAAVRRHL